jgi:hypothetical protein
MSELVERLFLGALITFGVILLLALAVATYGTVLLVLVPGLVWHYVATKREKEAIRKWGEKLHGRD